MMWFAVSLGLPQMGQTSSDAAIIFLLARKLLHWILSLERSQAKFFTLEGAKIFQTKVK
jgi:hypothetical protein